MALPRIFLLALACLGLANGREPGAELAAGDARIIAALPVVPPGLNGSDALETLPSVSVFAVHTHTVSAPDLIANEWVLFAARPPDLGGQNILDAATSPGSEPVYDQSPLRQPLMRARVLANSPRLKKQITFATRVEARLFSRRLIHRSGKSPGTAKLAARERELFLRHTPQFDYTSQVLRHWMDSNKLARAGDEGEVDFARRVFLVIVRGFKYEYLGKQDRSAANVCAAARSDCGGLAVLFATALRSQGIPARTLAGRWAVSAMPAAKIGGINYHQEHVKAEFFAQGVGWVPVDLSSAILHDRSAGKLEYFGKDKGDFITLHFDNDLALDTLFFGVRPMPLLQRPSYWVRGSGNLDKAVVHETWKVTRTD